MTANNPHNLKEKFQTDNLCMESIYKSRSSYKYMGFVEANHVEL